jgi:hypothetical protein
MKINGSGNNTNNENYDLLGTYNVRCCLHTLCDVIPHNISATKEISPIL